MHQRIEGDIGTERWAAMLRAAEFMSTAGVKFIKVSSDRKTMGTGMKAIWDIASFWWVLSEMGRLCFLKVRAARLEGGWEVLGG